MSTLELAKALSQVDEPEQWKSHIPSFYTDSNKAAFELAEPLWIKRMIATNKLYLHPNVIKHLKAKHFKPTDLQKRMIWASILAANDDKARKIAIKKLVKEKYGFDWWEDVYGRTERAWVAKERINKKLNSNGSGMNALISNTNVFGNAAQYEIESALKNIAET